MSVEIPIVNAGYLSVQNLQIARTGNAAATVAAGQARDSSNVNDIVLASAATLNAASVGANGLDTGSLAASTVYALYVIGDSSQNNDAAVILSLSQSAPALPYGYDMYRKIGFLTTDASSHFLAGYWYGNSNMRMFAYDAPQATAITAGNATSYTGVALTALVPAQDNLPVMMQSVLTPASAGNAVFLQPYGATGDAVVNKGQVTAVVLENIDMVMAKLNSSAPSIKYKVSNGSDAVALNVAGYTYSI